LDQGELIVRVNPEKVNVAMRTEQLVRLAHRFIGETTSKVYRAFLQVLEEQTPRCYDVLKADPEADANSNNTLIIDSKASVLKIAEVIDPSVDLHDGLAESTDGINGNSGDSLVNRGHLVEKHMKILSEDPRQFASWASSRGISEWYVEFPRLSRYLIQNQIEETVQSRFERLGMRLLRLLHSKGKLDEKQVANGSMSLPKLIRPALSQMQAAGFLDLQEIPKDNSRHPSRTIFLWFYDQDRVRRLLLEDACKAMARILQRIEVEREELREVLDKAERTDIKGNEDKYLSKIERQKLRQWAQIEAKLSIQLERVDELVGILRDFLGPIP
jgi:DNA-directed RNA polymerase III subunit RPC3